MSSIVLIDANNLSFAAYHARGDSFTSKGVPTGLLDGTLKSLLTLSRLFSKSPLVMVWDGPGASWRKKVSPHRYKANRVTVGDTREICMGQIEQLMPILDYVQIPQLRLTGVEGDDLIGILATEFKQDFDSVIIRSADKDFYQLLDEQVRVFRGQYHEAHALNEVTVWDSLMDVQKLQQAYKVRPSQWTTFRALMGDSSDNLKGLVSGVGEVYASRIVASGLKLPAYDCPAIRKMDRLSRKEITRQDWSRANQNFELCKIVTDATDSKIPGSAQKEISQFVGRLRAKGFSRDARRVDDWQLCKMLGKFELMDVSLRVRDLVKIF